ncbi:MAG: DUF1599 domain-containing protein [Odoribacter sp.]|nr:DUF1599 domain-containing protein [Odoribacter sp.]
MDTNSQIKEALATCRKIFVAKLHDYGPSWRLLRASSVTDQIFIKAKRIRSLQVKGHSAVGEGILPEFMAMVNYGIIGIIQLQLGYVDTKDISTERAIELYDSVATTARQLLEAKNHDYDEAWRSMRVSSYVDFILTKIERIKEIEDHEGATEVSEGIDANYLDIVNYSLFGIIKLTE